jgi:uncharacterized membrane protein YoaT (DUF817 family)
MNKEHLIEFWRFFLANAYASYFGAFLLVVFVVSSALPLSSVTRYDLIFLAAILFQITVLFLRLEKLREFLVILLFHILATIMELFKTHPEIGSWSYPGYQSSIFVLATVPLFSGFLYSAVGSYISRAFIFMKLSYKDFPAYYHLWIIALLIYLNFFTHHFIFDMRYLLFLYISVVFFRTSVSFQVYKKRRSIPFLLSAFLTAFFVWVAENIATFTKVWLYPTQVAQWHMVSFEKLGSWFLLLILSFALVSIVYRERLSDHS